MKLLLLFPSEYRGGVEEYMLTIGTAAVKNGWDVCVAFPETPNTASLIRDFSELGVRYHRLEIAEYTKGKWGTNIRYPLQLARTIAILLNVKPDVVQISLAWPIQCFSSILACGLLKMPTAVVFQLAPQRFPFSELKLKLYDWARNRHQQWITISENNRKFICDSFQVDPKEIEPIYNGTKMETDPDAIDNDLLRDRVRAEFKLPADCQLILTVANLDPRKGYDDLIPAIPHLVKDFPHVRFIWVGEGEQREYLTTRLQEYDIEDKVFLIGRRSDVPRLLKAADLFVFPTHLEGLPFALLEAMAQGLPVVASDASSIPEIIEQQVHGLIFRVGDSCEILENLRWALKHPDEMKNMADLAAIRVKDFSQEKMLDKTLSVLDRLARTT